jgi:hypothetical protein
VNVLFLLSPSPNYNNRNHGACSVNSSTNFWLALAASIMPFSILAQTNAEMNEQAVKLLPDDLKAGATVFKYDADSGDRIVLRQGSNQVECQPMNEDGFTAVEQPLGGGSQRHANETISTGLI